MEEIIEILRSMIEELRTDLREIRNDQREYHDDKNLRLENNEVEKPIIVLENKNEEIEKKERRNNLITSGVSIKEKEPEQIKQTIENTLDRYLNVKSEIFSIIKINDRMCKIEMKNGQEKENVVKNKGKLRHVKQKIYINHDFTEREQGI